MGRILGHGIDLIECRRIEELAERHGERFLRRVFTEAELKYCLDRAHRWQHLAGRFAAKEAVLKALGTGWRGQIAWTDVEVTNDPLGRPTVRLDGDAEQHRHRLGPRLAGGPRGLDPLEEPRRGHRRWRGGTGGRGRLSRGHRLGCRRPREGRDQERAQRGGGKSGGTGS